MTNLITEAENEAKKLWTEFETWAHSDKIEAIFHALIHIAAETGVEIADFFKPGLISAATIAVNTVTPVPLQPIVDSSVTELGNEVGTQIDDTLNQLGKTGGTQ